jgi:U3 small nucleolar RNA-associated protein 14
MLKWKDVINTNRHQRTLDLANDQRPNVSYKNLITKFNPTTELEKDIQMVLISTGTNEKDAEQREIDELIERGLTIEEIQEKQNELAKVRSRMFYEQMKRHRINKIKSKAVSVFSKPLPLLDSSLTSLISLV